MARSFDGTNDELSVSSAIVTTFPATLACWFYRTAKGQTRAIQAMGNSGAVSEFRISLESTAAGGAVRMLTNGGSANSTSTTYNTNQWHHACGVWAADNSRSIYLDGGGKTTLTSTIATSGLDRFRLGNVANNGSNSFYSAGSLAHAAIWGVALSDSEILALAGGANPLRIRSGSLKGYWPVFGNGSSEPNYGPGGSVHNLTVTEAAYSALGPRVQPPFAWTFGWHGHFGGVAPAAPTSRVPRRRPWRVYRKVG